MGSNFYVRGRKCQILGTPALNCVTLNAVLSYKSGLSLMICLNFLYIDIVLLSCISFIQRESSHDFTNFFIFAAL